MNRKSRSRFIPKETPSHNKLFLRREREPSSQLLQTTQEAGINTSACPWEYPLVEPLIPVPW
ncbi:hypothetical protein C1H46_025037 [Malus baccata]|uniref:Uncharacterized protein n=1 Tax=Malus baccata TaxID=106549 RepID=A0A540LSA6_MALBA|nr:hypothetical protein C1H46_025037 [Malus baccata]